MTRPRAPDAFSGIETDGGGPDCTDDVGIGGLGVAEGEDLFDGGGRMGTVSFPGCRGVGRLAGGGGGGSFDFFPSATIAFGREGKASSSRKKEALMILCYKLLNINFAGKIK